MNSDKYKITLPNHSQIVGSLVEPKLHALVDYGIIARATDLVKATGASCGNTDYCNYFTKSSSVFDLVEYITYEGELDSEGPQSRRCAIRPVLEITDEDFFQECTSKAQKCVSGDEYHYELEYGYYPQKAASSDLQQTLEKLYQNNGEILGNPKRMCRINWKYTFDSADVDAEDIPFMPALNNTYKYDGKYYVRKYVNTTNYKFANGLACRYGNYIWLEVTPIKWLFNVVTKTLISKDALLAGIKFDSEKKYHEENFERTDIYDFLTKCFVNELNQGTALDAAVFKKDVVPSNIKTKDKINPYGFNFDEVSEEDIIRGSVESDVPVFLHAKSGDGKSARAKELDPDCTIIYMRTATPDSLNGKSVYNSQTGEMIDVKPSWLKKLEEKCAKEPDKLHILFFDELTNALPSIQSMAFNIVLDKEVNGIWKLPENSRIIAAGNDMEDSLAANQMAEPLFNRFAHVYIETTPEEWLEWATTPEEDYERLEYKKSEKRSKIHPAIYAFIAGNTYNDRGASVLRTKPKTDELKPHADPRKWELASKVLYATNNPEMLRGLIGEELTKEFVEFTQVKTITVEDVINGDYTENDLRMNTAERFATAVGLSSVDEEHFTVVREFMLKIGAEVCAAFESMWHHGNQKRLMMIAEAQASQGGRMI